VARTQDAEANGAADASLLDEILSQLGLAAPEIFP